jgi:hypothetical protein
MGREMTQLIELISNMPDERFYSCLVVFGMLGITHLLTKKP